MKINKFKLYAITCGLIGSISLCGNIVMNRQYSKKIATLEIELQHTKNDLETLKIINTIDSIEDLNKYFEGYLRFYINDYEPTLVTAGFDGTPLLTIEGRNKLDEDFIISDELYRKINLVLSKYNISSLRLQNLNRNIDLSKFQIVNEGGNLENDNFITELIIDSCADDLDYDQFLNLRPTYIHLYNMEFGDCIKSWLEKENLENISLIIDSDKADYLQFLSQTDRQMNSLKIICNSDEEALKLLPKINVKNVTIESLYLYQSNLSFDLTLNDNTENLKLLFINCDRPVNHPNEIESVNVNSNCSTFNLIISSDMLYLEHTNSMTYITENTEFNLPSNSTICLGNIRYATKEQLNSKTFQSDLKLQRLNGTIEYEPSIDYDVIVSKLTGNDKQKVKCINNTN